MPTNTTELQLYKKDPATDGGTNFDVKVMMNDNWDKIDARAATERAHRESTTNPHNTTAAQVGAYTKAEADTMAQGKADTAQTQAINFAKSFGLGDVAKSLAANTDLNNLDATGFYQGATLTNAPSTGTFYIIHIKQAANYKLQIACHVVTNELQTRLSNNGTWTAWSKLETTTGAQSKATAAETAAKSYTDTHAADKNNPHAVTAAQVGAYTKAEADGKYETPTGAQTKATTAKDDAINWAKGFGLGGIAKDISSTDLNSLDATGFYKGSVLTNCPTGVADVNNFFFVVNIKQDTAVKMQMAWRGYSSGYSAFFRQNNNGTWSAWTQLETTAGAQSKADTAESNARTWAKSFGLGDVAKEIKGTDLNSLDMTGFYVGDNLANGPTAAGTGVWYYVIHLKQTATYKLQIAVRNSGNGQVFQRVNENGTWTTWTQLATQDWVKSFGLGGTTQVTTDPNTLDGSGFYFVQNTATNVPVTGVYYGLTHIKTSDTGAMQIAVMMNGTSGNRTFTRTKASGAWNAWAELLTTDNGVPYTGATKAVNLGSQSMTANTYAFPDGNGDGLIFQWNEDADSGKLALKARYASSGAVYNTVLHMNPEGILNLPLQPYVSAARNTTASLSAGVDTMVGFTTEYADRRSEFANSAYVPKEGGIYVVNAHGHLNTAMSGLFDFIIYDNGSPMTRIYAEYNARTFSMTRVLEFVAGRSYTFYIQSDSAVTLEQFNLQVAKLS